jgi:manganese transport protein
VFFRQGIIVTEIQQAHQLLSPLLGTTLAGTLFALALISAGQSSTLTGTLAGQIVMEGFLQFKMRPVLRRLVTRLIAIVPAIIVISIQGEQGSYSLLIMSQVLLSLQLPFAVIPLIKLTSDRALMGQFANTWWMKGLAWIAASVIVGLNAYLVVKTLTQWIGAAGSGAVWPWVTAVPFAAGVALLLVYITIPQSWRRKKMAAPPVAPLEFSLRKYTRVGVALDYGEKDGEVLSHAQTFAQQQGATVYLFHVVEGVSGQLFGKDAYDVEARKDQEHLEEIAQRLRASGVNAIPLLGFGRVPEQLVRLAQENAVDLLVMGGHRHRGLKDIIFGASISKVRHALSIPVLVVQ